MVDGAHTIRVTVLYFASAQTAAGIQLENIELSVPTPDAGYPLSKLSDELVARHPVQALADVLRISQWSIDEELIPADAVAQATLRGGECVAIIPPVSGG